MNEVMAKVVCASCGWQGRRKTGKLVDCPSCGRCAGFDIDNSDLYENLGQKSHDAFDSISDKGE